MNQQAKTKMYEDIQRHGEQLNQIFKTNFDPIDLCKRLKRSEQKAHSLQSELCNGTCPYSEKMVKSIEKAILSNLDKLLHYKEKNIPVFINGDPRGYALKIRSEWVNEQYQKSNGAFRIYTDWGGYGILAPDFTPNK